MLNPTNVRKVIDHSPSLTRIGRYFYGFDSWTSSIYKLHPDDVGLDGNARLFINQDGTIYDCRIFVQRVLR